jgi:acyl carrier protein
MNKKIPKNFIENELKKINKRYKNLDPKKNYFEQGMDSLDFFTLIFLIEKKFKIKISSKNYKSFNTTYKIQKYIKNK